MGLIRLYIILLLCLSWYGSFAQPGKFVPPFNNNIYPNISTDLMDRSLQVGDSIFIILGNCKSNWVIFLHKEIPIPVTVAKVSAPNILPKKIPFLSIHGNVLYNFSYRSYIDTPYAESNVMQHMVQTSMNLLIKGKYPVKLTLRNRSSNSPYFENSTDVNLEFNRQSLINNIKTDLKAKAKAKIPVNASAFTKAEQLYNNRKQEVQNLQSWVNSPQRAQEFIEEKERALNGSKLDLSKKAIVNKGIEKLGTGKTGSAVNKMFSLARGNKGFNKDGFESLIGQVKDSVNKLADEKKNFIIDSAKNFAQHAKDSIARLAEKNKPAVKDSSLLEKYNNKKQQLDSLQSLLKKEEALVKQQKKKIQDSADAIKKQINSLSNTSGLYAFMKENGIAKNELTKAQRILLSINKIGIGRNWVDYSELTVKNISLSGVNIEINPLPFYFAFAAGKVNYRFRDFVLKNNKQLPNQSLYLIRAGIGQKEKNNFILTFYNGKKSVLNYTVAGGAGYTQRVLGISAETRMAINENTYIIAEVAKSSYYDNSALQPSSSDLVGKAFNLKTNTNLAYSIKLFSQNPGTNTRVTGYYKKVGENFQSYNLYPMNVNQEAWMLRVNQYFWKRKLDVDAAIRKNDFNSPIAAPSFSTKTIFKSFQVTLRIPKYPYVSVGYYPSSQISVQDNNLLVENQYNTLNAITGYSYRIKNISMSTNATYTKFYNNGADTGFIYFNASSWTINHSIFLPRFTFQTSAGLTDQKDIHLVTLEQLLSYQFKERFSLTGGIKWNRLNRSETLFGGTAAMSIYVKRLGTFQFNYDKTFLPGYSRKLMPVDIGRMTYLREF